MKLLSFRSFSKLLGLVLMVAVLLKQLSFLSQTAVRSVRTHPDQLQALPLPETADTSVKGHPPRNSLTTTTPEVEPGTKTRQAPPPGDARVDFSDADSFGAIVPAERLDDLEDEDVVDVKPDTPPVTQAGDQGGRRKRRRRSAESARHPAGGDEDDDPVMPFPRTARNEKVINPHDFRYVINNQTLCQTPSGSPRLHHLIVIHSPPSGAALRQAVRHGWAQNDLLHGFPSRLLFFMGRRRGAGLEDVKAESRRYGDIVLEDFIDDYRNLSRKAVGVARWVSVFCPRVKYVIKADLDVYVNVFLLVQRLHQVAPPTRRFFLCRLYRNRPILRDPRTCAKWCVPEEELRGRTSFPPYCSGAVYAFTPEVADDVFAASLYAPYFFIDDVFTTGLLVESLGTIKHVDLGPRSVLVAQKRLQGALREPSATQEVVGIHDTTHTQLTHYWRDNLVHLGVRHVEMLGKEKHERLLKEAQTEHDMIEGPW